MSEFFAMGGHAAYIWSSYGLAVLVLVVLLLVSLRGLRRQQALLAALETAHPSRRRRRQTAEEGLAAPAGSARSGTHTPAGEGGLS